MKYKISSEIQNEIEYIKQKVQVWQNLFDVEVELYFDGWAIFLREKIMYPRSIIIFKSYEDGTYSIKSFEIHLKNYKDEEFRELYAVERIKNRNDLLIELKDVIYGKDLISDASNMCKNTFIQ
jgi:hypothetical protein